MKKVRYQFLTLLGAGSLLASSLFAGQADYPEVVQHDESALAQWWNGKYATGNWFGLRDTLADRGLTFQGTYKANFLGIVSGGLQQRFGYDDEFRFGVNLDVAKLTGWEAVKGLSFSSTVRYRGGAGINKYSGASGTFAPTAFQSGRLWRFLSVYATYTTPELFGAKEFLTISGGWQNPSDFFLVQPESKFFLNNAISTTKGISPNGSPWGGSYAAWGGYIKVKPLEWYYAQAGLYLAMPYGTDTANHGLAFQGYHPDPNANGLYFLAETGFTPKIGPAKLPGRYSAGFLYWGLENTSFFGATYDQKVQFYFQADQQVYREPSPVVESPVYAKGPTDGKGVYKQVEEPEQVLSNQGLYAFNLVNFAPKYNNVLPFYFQTGLVYKGLIPTRDNDQFGVAFALGNYSYYKILSEYNSGIGVHQTYEGVVEIDYRFQINKWAYIQPNFQYIIRPGGTGLVQNDAILGFQVGVNF